MIDWKSKPEEFQKKYKFDNVRLMCSHMLDADEQISVTLGHNFTWSVVTPEKVLIESRDGDFEEVVDIYIDFNKQEKALEMSQG